MPITSINGEAFVVGSDGIEDGSVTDAKLSDAIRADIGRFVDDPYRLKESTWTGWVNGSISASGGKIVFRSSTVRCRLLTKAKYLARIEPQYGYEAAAFVYDPSDNTLIYIKSFTRYGFSVPQYDEHDYSVALCVRRYSEEDAFPPSEAVSAVVFKYSLYNTVTDSASYVRTRGRDTDRLLHATYDTELEPVSVEDGHIYFLGNSSYARGVQVATYSTLKKYNIESGKTYVVSSDLYASSAGYAIVTYFNASDEVVGYQFYNEVTTEYTNPLVAELEVLSPPATATWCYVNQRTRSNKASALYERRSGDISLDNREVSVLFIGNSLTQDGIAYLPYVLRTYYPSVRFRFYMWYCGGHTLAQHYNKFINDTPCTIFSVAENVASWTNYSNSKTMASILGTYRFDVVCVQEYFNYKETYTTDDLVDWNNVRDYVQEHYAGGNPLEFISLLHAPLRSDADTVFARTVDDNKLILRETISDDLLNIGAAVYRAMQTSLDELGDHGHLSPDGTHTQEGLPCLLQTYVVLQWVLERLGLDRNVYGLGMKMTNAIYQTLNVPGANLGSGVIEGTDEQNILAQQVAIWAYKYGKRILSDGMPDIDLES